MARSSEGDLDAPEEREPLLSKEDEQGEFRKRVGSISEAFLDTRNQWYDWIVPAHAFQEYPHALFCARLTMCFLLVVVLISLIVLLVYYALGVVQIEREYYWYDAIKVPTLVICPDWGERPRGFDNFTLGNTYRGRYPSIEGVTRRINHTMYDCMDSAPLFCKCIDFDGQVLKKHERGTDLVKVSFNASSTSRAFLFGFNEPGPDNLREVPQTFSYGLFGNRALGFLTLHLIDLREQKVGWSLRGRLSKFRDVRLYDWEIAGESVPVQPNGTELLFGFKTFQVARDQTFSALWSPFAIISVVVMAMSIINNLNIFGLVFPLQQHPVFTQREPSVVLRGLCDCCGCMQRKHGRPHARTKLEQLLQEHQDVLQSLATPRASSLP